MSNIRFGVRASRFPGRGGDITYPLWGFEPTSIDDLVAMLRKQQRTWANIGEAGTVSLYLIDPKKCEHGVRRFSQRNDYEGEYCAYCGEDSNDHTQRAASQEEIVRRQEEEKADSVLEQLAGKKMPWRRYRAKVGDELCWHKHRSLDRAFGCLKRQVEAYVNLQTGISWEWLHYIGVSVQRLTIDIEIAVIDEQGSPVTYESVEYLRRDRLF